MKTFRNLSVVLLTPSMAIWFNFILPCDAPSCQTTELDFILSYNPLRDAPGADKAGSHFTPGFRSIFTGAIRFYQLFISTQDKPVCNFIPSCSQFGVESIREFGLLRGILLTSDRLQRCNGMSTSRYQVDYISGRLIDPVRIYKEAFTDGE